MMYATELKLFAQICNGFANAQEENSRFLDEVTRLRSENASLVERVKALEEEVGDLLAQLEDAKNGGCK